MDLELANKEFLSKSAGVRSTIVANELGCIVSLSGAFDVASSAALLDYFVVVVESIGAGKRLIVDLGQVTYLPSTGVGAISTALIRAKKCDVAFTVKNVPDTVARVIKLLGIWDYLHVE